MTLALFVAALTVSFTASNTSAANIDLLSSTNATWTADAGIPSHATCTIAPRVSGDSVVASWTMNKGTWDSVWVSVVGTLTSPGLLHGADSIKTLYKNNDSAGCVIRLTQYNGTMWQEAPYLNGLVGLQAVNLPLNVTTFPQLKFATTDPTGTFNLDSVKTISFVSNKNPTVLTATPGVTGVYKIMGLTVTTNGASGTLVAQAKPINNMNIHIASNGFTTTKQGMYSISLYSVNGALVNRVSSQFAAGFNKIDFSKLGSGICIAKISGNGFTASNRLVLSK